METGLPPTLTSVGLVYLLGYLKPTHTLTFPHTYLTWGVGVGHSLHTGDNPRQESQPAPAYHIESRFSVYSVGPSLRFRCGFSWLDDLSQDKFIACEDGSWRGSCWRASRLGKNWWQLVAARVPVTMRSLRLLRIPFLCGLLWAFCAPGARAEEPGASSSHHGSMGLDKNTVHDQEHIMEHLEGVINKPEAEMSPQELQLHYFKMHDYDGNNLLDGLELSTAITHVHKEEGSEQAPMNEDELINLIDGVLRDDDKNNDGYIDYAEFAKSLQ